MKSPWGVPCGLHVDFWGMNGCGSDIWPRTLCSIGIFAIKKNLQKLTLEHLAARMRCHNIIDLKNVQFLST